MRESDTLKWFWERASTSEERKTLLGSVSRSGDPNTLKWFWERASTSGERHVLLEGVAESADTETSKWFWERTSTSAERATLLQSLTQGGDAKTLKWFWERTSTSGERKSLLEGVAKSGDSEALRWFWERASTSQERAILLGSAGNGSTKPEQRERRAQSPSKSNTSDQDVQGNYDVFISHASEDKDSFVRYLATALRDCGLKVWYDEFTLSVGDSLRRSIDQGLAKSRFGVVVLSHSFFAKAWPQKELDGLVAKENGKEKVILPVWHNISKPDVARRSPTLADRVALNTQNGMKKVVDGILEVLQQ